MKAASWGSHTQVEPEPMSADSEHHHLSRTNDTIVPRNRNVGLDEMSEEKPCFLYSLRKEFVIEQT